MSCGVGRRGSSDLAWLWLWCRPVATALSRPLAWEPPCAVGVAQKNKRKKKRKQPKKLNMFRILTRPHCRLSGLWAKPLGASLDPMQMLWIRVITACKTHSASQ